MGILSTQGIQFQLVAEGQILDLFKDEDILLSDNVTGLFDLGIIPADFTRQITLPGTKKNNAFFEHVYDISVYNPDTFATNVKVQAFLDFGGLYLSQGYLQLNKVNIFANKFIDSYEVTVYGAVSSFAREINRNFLNDLDTLSVYNHTSSFTNISSSWNGGLFSGSIVYPLAEYGQRLEFTKGALSQFGVDDIAGALSVQDFKPAIKAKLVFDAIFEEAGYTYSSSFLEPYKSSPTVFNVTNNGSGNYVINGVSNPTLELVRGQTYTFNVSASGHPFWIKTTQTTGTANQYNDGVTNNGTDNGTITFTVPQNVPVPLYYNCQYHSSMAGTLNIVKSVIDDVYLLCNRQLKYPVYDNVNLETFGVVRVGAITGSGMTDVLLPADTFVTLPWYNKLEDPQNFYNNGAYKVEVSSSLRGVLNLNVNVSCSVNNMPGTFSANGTWQLRLIETGSGTQYSLNAIQSYIQFFDELQQSRSGGINTTYQLQSEFTTAQLPIGNYYFQIKQRPNVSTGTLPTVTMDPGGTTKSFLNVTKVNQAADGRVMNIPLNMPFGTNGIKQIDFLTSIQKKFNLVIYPSKTQINEFIVEPFNQWYNKGRRWDFNQYANLNDRIEVIPANNLAVNELNFTDTLDQDYISQQFSKAANREFGKSYFTDTENFFSQGKFEVKTAVSSTQLLQVAGTGVSGSVANLNPTPTSFQWSMGYQGYSDSNDACSNTYYYPIQVYTAEQSPYTISYFYEDSLLTIPFNGGNQYWKFYSPSFGASYYVAEIGTAGYNYYTTNC